MANLNLDLAMGNQPGLDIEAALQPAPAKQVATQSLFQQTVDSLNAAVPGVGLGDYVPAALHHMLNLPHGLAQVIENGVQKAANSIAPDSAVTKKINEVAAQTNAAMAQRDNEYQNRVKDSPGAYAGAVVGEIAPFVFGGGLTSALKRAGDLAASPLTKLAAYLSPGVAQNAANLAGKVVSGAVQGGAIGAASPVTDNTSDYWGNKAAQVKTGMEIGGATPVVISGGSALANNLKGVLDPVFRPKVTVANSLKQWIGNDPQAINALANPPQYVPGSMPTTAQVVANPAIVQAEKAAGNNPNIKQLLMQREIDNNAARLAALRGVAGTPNDLAAAIDARSNASDPLYAQAKAALIKVDNDPQWQKLAKTNAISRAIPVAQENLQNYGKSVFDAAGNMTGEGAHEIKMVLDDAVDFNPSNSLGKSQRASIANVRDSFLNWLDNRNPPYAQARQTYKAMSPSVDTMDTGQQLMEVLINKSANAGGDPNVTLTNYANQLAKALRKAEYGISPQAETTLKNIQNDLQRSTISNSVKMPGSDTKYNINADSWLGKALYGPNFSGPTGAGRVVGAILGGALTGHPIIGAGAGYAAAEKLGNVVGNRVNKVLAEALLNPQYAAQLLQTNPSAAQQVILSPALSQLMQKAPQVSTALSFNSPVLAR